jgi:hypothetical protein
LREDLEQLTALHDSEGCEDYGAAVEKSELIISALEKGVQWQMISIISCKLTLCLKCKHKVNTFMGLHKEGCKSMLKKAEQSEITLFSTKSLCLPPPCTVHHLITV